MQAATLPGTHAKLSHDRCAAAAIPSVGCEKPKSISRIFSTPPTACTITLLLDRSRCISPQPCIAWRVCTVTVAHGHGKLCTACGKNRVLHTMSSWAANVIVTISLVSCSCCWKNWLCAKLSIVQPSKNLQETRREKRLTRTVPDIEPGTVSAAASLLQNQVGIPVLRVQHFKQVHNSGDAEHLGVPQPVHFVFNQGRLSGHSGFGDSLGSVELLRLHGSPPALDDWSSRRRHKREPVALRDLLLNAITATSLTDEVVVLQGVQFGKGCHHVLFPARVKAGSACVRCASVWLNLNLVLLYNK